jgi:hypothetical protein
LDALVAAVEAGTMEVSDTRADRQGRCAVRRAGEDVHAHLRDELAARELRLPNLPATRVALVVLEYEFIRRADEDLDEEVAGDGGEGRYVDWRDQQPGGVAGHAQLAITAGAAVLCTEGRSERFSRALPAELRRVSLGHRPRNGHL